MCLAPAFVAQICNLPVSVELASFRDAFLCRSTNVFRPPLPSATAPGGSDVAKRVECGVSRRFWLPGSQAAHITGPCAKAKAAGYAALQTLRAIALRLGRLGRAGLYRRIAFCEPRDNPGAPGIFVAPQNTILRYNRLEICATPPAGFTAATS